MLSGQSPRPVLHARVNRAMPGSGSGRVSTAARCSPAGSSRSAAPCLGGASPWKAAAQLPSHFPFSRLSTLAVIFRLLLVVWFPLGMLSRFGELQLPLGQCERCSAPQRTQRSAATPAQDCPTLPSQPTGISLPQDCSGSEPCAHCNLCSTLAGFLHQH